MSGVDSAYGPSPAQVQAFHEQGHSWWGWYCGGAGAYHAWSDNELHALWDNGVTLTVPIFVPRMTQGRIHPSANPELDAQYACYFTGLRGWVGVMALDTEYSMRGDPWTREYEWRFGQRVIDSGWKAVTYAGGFTYNQPPVHTPWWIVPHGEQAPNNVCWQTGQDTLTGLAVDVDHAGNGFPLAHHG